MTTSLTTGRVREDELEVDDAETASLPLRVAMELKESSGVSSDLEGPS